MFRKTRDTIGNFFEMLVREGQRYSTPRDTRVRYHVLCKCSYCGTVQEIGGPEGEIIIKRVCINPDCTALVTASDAAYPDEAFNYRNAA